MNPELQDLLASGRLISPWLSYQETSVCARVSKDFKCLSRQFCNFPYPSDRAIQAYHRGCFLKWNELSLTCEEHWRTLCEWLLCEVHLYDSCFLDRYPFEVLKIGSDYETEEDMECILGLATNMPHLHTIEFNVTSCAGLCLSAAMDGSVTFPTVKCVKIKGDTVTYDSCRNAFPNLETLYVIVILLEKSFSD